MAEPTELPFVTPADPRTLRDVVFDDFAASSAKTESFICLALSTVLGSFVFEDFNFDLGVSAGRLGTESAEMGRRGFVVGGGIGKIDFSATSKLSLVAVTLAPAESQIS